MRDTRIQFGGKGRRKKRDRERKGTEKGEKYPNTIRGEWTEREKRQRGMRDTRIQFGGNRRRKERDGEGK